MKIHAKEIWTDDEGTLHVIEWDTDNEIKLVDFVKREGGEFMGQPVPRQKFSREANCYVETLNLQDPNDKNRFDDLVNQNAPAGINTDTPKRTNSRKR
jgi:hypothetical protein